MDVHWSPRKRIKLNGGAAKSKSQETSKVASPIRKEVITQSSPLKGNLALKRVSTDFAKELDELLEKPEGMVNPTQVFVVDHDLELAMLRADIDQPPAPTFPDQRAKRSLSRTLSRWEQTPLTDASNQDVRRHASDPVKKVTMLTQGPSQLIDELEGIDINELTAALETAENQFSGKAQFSTQECTQKSLEVNPDGLEMFSARCTIEAIPLYSQDSSGVGMKVTEQSSGKTRYVTLQGVWLASYHDDPWQLQAGDTIHLLCTGKTWEADHITIGDSDELFPDIIVFHPDTIISSTTLSASATCHRRSVIQNRVLAPSIGPAPTDADDIARCLSPIIGNCVHEAVQAAAVKGDFSETYLMEAGETALNETMLSGIWACGALPSAVTNQLRLRLSSMSRWGMNQWPLLAKSLRACEAEIRPKSLGVTGKLDMDIIATSGARSCIEIKTGKPHAIHVGQVVLYYLLQYVDKHGNPDRDFSNSLPAEISREYILLYLPNKGEAETIRVKITARESQNIMRNRNSVASHTVRKTLPVPIFKKGDCQFCPTRVECSAHFLVENDIEDEWKRLGNAACFQKRTATALCEKSEVAEYQKTWMTWIDSQPTVEAVGGLSAVRRMRGNLLNMVSACLLKETGPHEGAEAAFFNWMPVLVGKSVGSIGKKSLCEFLSGYKPKTRVGRAACVVSSLSEADMATKLVGEVISPLLLQEERVLLCATSHTAVDNVLGVLLKAGLGDSVLDRATRLASKPTDVPEEIREKMLLPEDWMARMDEIEKSRLMFACTVKATHHDILCRGDFNLAVVVDAHTLSDPALWAVLLRARQVLLIGSHELTDERPLALFQRMLKAPKAPVVRWNAPTEDNIVVLDD
jgi:hypothetical protein